MGYAVLHLDKSSKSEAAMTAHIERTQMPKNADPSRTYLNKELINFPDKVTDRTQAIEHRLESANLTRKIGKNQVRVIRVMLTGNHNDMTRIQEEGKLDEWCNDNLEWLCKTYGAENLVSAVLHLDESTPHIHASVVPIVTGERRQKKQNPDQPPKKQYRKKSTDVNRLCADDIMTSMKLKGYQDSYGEKMAKYGLERGVVGSEARHITTQEFYRNVIAQQGDLQENIELLLQMEEDKRNTVEELKQKELHARSQTQQVVAEQKQAESELSEKQSELQKVKGELKTEKFKSTAAEVGTKAMSKLDSWINPSKVDRQQKEIEELKTENKNLKTSVEDSKRDLQAKQKGYEKEIAQKQRVIESIQYWLPDTPQLMRYVSHCLDIGFSEEQTKALVNRQPVQFSGELHSAEFSRKFKADNATVRIERHPSEPSRLRLTINGTDIVQWFRDMYKIFQRSIGIEPKQKQSQGRGI